MGFRQPTRVGAFFKQASAGREEQKKARETLKTPQALGGAAAAGTQMVANTTQARKEETQNVKTTATKAQQDLSNIADVGNQTTMVITGKTEAQRKSVQDQINKINEQLKTATPEQAVKLNAEKQKLTTKLNELNKPPPAPVKVASADQGIGAINNSAEEMRLVVTDLEREIEKFDAALKNASAADAIAINKEKERLTKVLEDYRKKMSEGNLGQIAGPSTYETLLDEQLASFATPGQEVGKLASIFAPGWDKERYGALESQTYGKDLEGLESEAAAALLAKEKALSEAGLAKTGYGLTLDEGKKEFETELDKRQEALKILKMSPEELASYTREDLEKIFGKDNVIKLFDFDSDNPDAKVTGVTSAQVRTALTDRITAQKAEQEKVEAEQKKAINALWEKQTQPTVDRYLGKEDPFTGESQGGVFNDTRTRIDGGRKVFDDQLSNYNYIESKWWIPQHKGWSEDKGNIEAKIKIYKDWQTAMDRLEQEFRQAVTDKDWTKVASYDTKLAEVEQEFQRRIREQKGPSQYVHVSR